jgi:hypothetical protein
MDSKQYYLVLCQHGRFEKSAIFLKQDINLFTIDFAIIKDCLKK